MGIKEQFQKIKENWMVIVVFLVVIFLFSGFNFTPLGISGVSDKGFGSYAEGSIAAVDSARSFYPGYGDDFAPEIEERRISYSASLSLEVDRGDFDPAVDEFNRLVAGNEAIVTNQNINTVGDGLEEIQTGFFSIRIPLERYDFFLESLKDLGEVESFNENAIDITGTYVDLQTELTLEREKLQRYESLLNQASNIEEKINLADRIFQQERRIAYLEESLEGKDQVIEYATISFTLQEEVSDLAGIDFVDLSDLIKNFVSSLSSIFVLIFVAIPYVVVILLIWAVVKAVRKK